MRILVTGASGFIGGRFVALLRDDEVHGAYHSRPRRGMVGLDLLDAPATRRAVESIRPDAILHCAGRPSVDWCEEHPAAAGRLNCEATLNVLAASEVTEARVVFLSTDYVFDGISGPYAESAPTRPMNAYGRMKLEMEKAVLGRRGDNLVVRTTNVYGFDLESKNFLMVVLGRLARGEVVQVAEDQYGTPTTVTDLCLATRELAGEGAGGLYHVAGPDYVNRLEWARAAARAFDLDPTLLRGAPTSALGQGAPRPLRAGLVSEHLRMRSSLRLRSLQEGLRQMRQDRDRLSPELRPF